MFRYNLQSYLNNNHTAAQLFGLLDKKQGATEYEVNFKIANTPFRLRFSNKKITSAVAIPFTNRDKNNFLKGCIKHFILVNLFPVETCNRLLQFGN